MNRTYHIFRVSFLPEGIPAEEPVPNLTMRYVVLVLDSEVSAEQARELFRKKANTKDTDIVEHLAILVWDEANNDRAVFVQCLSAWCPNLEQIFDPIGDVCS